MCCDSHATAQSFLFLPFRNIICVIFPNLMKKNPQTSKILFQPSQRSGLLNSSIINQMFYCNF